MTHIPCLLHSRHEVEKILSEESAVGTVGVNGEIAHAEAREVLEEMGALTGIHAIVFQRHLHDDLCRTYVWPFHGNAQPIVA